MKLPPFLVIDSCDGGGSTTQRDLLVAQLELHGVKALSTAQPSKGPAGRLIRDMLTGRESERMDPEAFQRLFLADRVDHLARVVEPARARGLTVVCDRGELSTAIYYAAGRPVKDEYGAIMRAIDWHRWIDAPTLTVILSVSAGVAAARRAARGGPVELFEQAEFQARVASLYQAEAARRPHHARGWALDQREQIARAPGLGGLAPGKSGWWIASVDGEGSVDEVAARVWAAVLPTVESWIAERG